MESGLLPVELRGLPAGAQVEPSQSVSVLSFSWLDKVVQFLVTLFYEIVVLFTGENYSVFSYQQQSLLSPYALLPQVEDMPSSSLEHSASSARPYKVKDETQGSTSFLMGVF